MREYTVLENVIYGIIWLIIFSAIIGTYYYFDYWAHAKYIDGLTFWDYIFLSDNIRITAIK